LALVGLGFVVGVYGTLIGAGGGFVLMPVLLLLHPQERPEHLTAISLSVVFANSASGSVAYGWMRRIDYRTGLMFAGAAIPGAVVGALNTSLMSRHTFNLVFSIAFIVVAVAMALRPDLRHRPQVKQVPSRFETTRHLVDSQGLTHDWTFQPWIGIVLSFFVGYFSSFLGIGGGVIHVPALVWLLHYPVHIATATSHFILAIMTGVGALVHVETGALHQEVWETLTLIVGVLPGAQLGAFLSSRVRSAWIIRSLAIALGLVGVRILLQSF
jgi:uncharacterized membrane protein YfcA